MDGAFPSAHSRDDGGANLMDARQSPELQLKSKIDKMVATLSGDTAQRWFACEGQRRHLPLLPRQGSMSLEDRAVSTVRWAFALLDVPASATRVLESHVQNEFTILNEEWWTLWGELQAYSSKIATDVGTDVVAANDINKRLECYHRGVAFSFEVYVKAKQIFTLIRWREC